MKLKINGYSIGSESEVPKRGPFLGAKDGNQFLASCIGSDRDLSRFELLPGLYPVVGPAGSGKTTFMFGRSNDYTDCLFSRVNENAKSKDVESQIWQISEPEYPAYSGPETAVKALIGAMMEATDTIFFVDSLRDLTANNLSGFSNIENLYTPAGSTLDESSSAVSGISSSMNELITHAAKLNVSPSNAIARGGLPVPYVNALAAIQSLASARGIVVFAVLNPLFVIEQNYYTVVDAVTQGSIRLLNSASLLRVYNYDGNYIQRITCNFGLSNGYDTYEIASILHSFYDEDKNEGHTGGESSQGE